MYLNKACKQADDTDYMSILLYHINLIKIMKLEKLKLKNKSLSKEAMNIAFGGRVAAEGTVTGGGCSYSASTGCYDCTGTPD